MRDKNEGFRFLLILACCLLMLPPLLGLAAWLLFHDRRGWTRSDLEQVVGIAAGFGGVITVPFAQTLFAQWLAERRRQPGPTITIAEVRGGSRIAVPTRVELEPWRTFMCNAVLHWQVRGQGSELDQILHTRSVGSLAAWEPVEAQVSHGRSRLKVRGRIVPWSQLIHEWDQARGPLVVVGEPGYGKTVAALTLVEHVNLARKKDQPFAALLPLVEWSRWYADHANQPFADWLVHHLATTYRVQVAGPRALVESGSLVPILDGLDEVPAGCRRACIGAIDAYVEGSPQVRPFVLTCRAREFSQLAPDWVAPDRPAVGLIGFAWDQIMATLDEETRCRSSWKPIRDRVAAHDPTVIELFRSPLRQATLLQAYNNRDPKELLEFDVATISRHVWDLLLTVNAPRFKGADTQQVLKWLEFLAAALKQEGGQRFSLHELYAYVPDRRAAQAMFALWLGLAAGALTSLAFGLVLGVRGAVVGVRGGTLVAVFFIENRRWEPSILVRAGWRDRASNLRAHIGWDLAQTLVVVMIVGAFFAPVAGVVAGFVWCVLSVVTDLVLSGPGELTISADRWRRTGGRLLAIDAPTRKERLLWTFGFTVLGAVGFGLHRGLDGLLAGALLGGLFGGLVALEPEVAFRSADPPQHLAAKGPTAVLSASRNNGLIFGVGFALLLALLGLTRGIDEALAGAIVGAVFGSLTIGHLQPWLYHHWVRSRLAGDGLVPRQLCEFLEWCCLPERRWLRATDAYEFRHRDLLDYLAGAGFERVLSSDDARAIPKAALCLGLLLVERGDTTGARTAFQRAITSEHSDVSRKARLRLRLGRLRSKKRSLIAPDVDRARVSDLSDTEVAARARAALNELTSSCRR